MQPVCVCLCVCAPVGLLCWQYKCGDSYGQRVWAAEAQGRSPESPVWPQGWHPLQEQPWLWMHLVSSVCAHARVFLCVHTCVIPPSCQTVRLLGPQTPPGSWRQLGWQCRRPGRWQQRRPTPTRWTYWWCPWGSARAQSCWIPNPKAAIWPCQWWMMDRVGLRERKTEEKRE